MLLSAAWGFSHVSDDDYARTVIAQSFAHAPRLDPSGTSWLPLPFWIAGASMLALGRSLVAARAVAWTLGSVAAVGPYLALRRLQIAPNVAWLAAALAALSPWSVWLASATVPEGWAASLVVTALLLAVATDARSMLAAAALVCAATLSRYEAWPVAAWLGSVFLLRAVRAPVLRPFAIVAALVASAGPLAWIAWNLHAHGDALHFFARVAAYRRDHGLGPERLADRLLGYPNALRRWYPEAVVGIVAIVVLRRSRAWIVPLVGVALALAFLVYGDVKDGAPTHHPERALCAVASTLSILGVVAVGSFDAKLRRRIGVIAAALFVVFSFSRIRFPPGSSPTERRDAQEALGAELATDPARTLEVSPCEYEHFAVIAAFGAPERVVVTEPLRNGPRAFCPRVVTR